MTTNLLDTILSRLGHLRTGRPELRFGQLIAIIGTLAEDETGHSLWDVEDAEFAAALNRFAADLARSESAAAEAGAAPDLGGLTSPPASRPPQPPRPVS